MMAAVVSRRDRPGVSLCVVLPASTSTLVSTVGDKDIRHPSLVGTASSNCISSAALGQLHSDRGPWLPVRPASCVPRPCRWHTRPCGFGGPAGLGVPSFPETRAGRKGHAERPPAPGHRGQGHTSTRPAGTSMDAERAVSDGHCAPGDKQTFSLSSKKQNLLSGTRTCGKGWPEALPEPEGSAPHPAPGPSPPRCPRRPPGQGTGTVTFLPGPRSPGGPRLPPGARPADRLHFRARAAVSVETAAAM